MAKRRTRSPHPGVVLLKPQGEHRSWRARWTDPDTGKPIKRRLPAACTTQEARRAWAVDLSRRLVHRSEELKAGAYRAEPHDISVAVGKWLESLEARLRPRSRKEYRRAAKRFVAWCETHQIRRTTDLTRGRLMAYRDHAIARRTKDGNDRSANARNGELRCTSVLLNWLADRDMLRVSDRDIRRACKPLPVPRDAPEFLDRVAIGKLPLQEPIVRWTLLTGMRISEVLSLEWQQIRDDAAHISATSKTHRARQVRLDVCPSLIEWLESTPEAKRKGRVFASWTLNGVARFCQSHGFTWLQLRRTCATFSCALPTLGPWQSAKRLGHSVTVSEKHYAGLVRVDPAARTLEAAMGLAQQLVEIGSSDPNQVADAGGT